MKKMIKTGIVMLTTVTTVAFCFSFVISGIMRSFSLKDDAALCAAILSFPSGSVFPTQATEQTQPPRKHESVTPTAAVETTAKTTHSGEAYPVEEKTITAGNQTIGGLQIRNTTDDTPDMEELLSCDLPFEIEDTHQVQVLVYHTHTCESYMSEDTGEYYDDFYPRSTDESQNVCAVGEAIVNGLKEKGIGAVHDTTLHDYPSYDGSYDRSYDTVQEYIEKYPDIKVTLDIHRDSMTADDNTKYKPVCSYQGRKAAQIMIMSGRNVEDDRFPFWEENLIFAAKLQQKCDELYEDFTRPLYFGDFTYNMNVNNGSLLIEVGTDANTLEEAVLSGEMLANALSSVLQNQ